MKVHLKIDCLIKKFNDGNMGVAYTTKELIQALHEKIDKLESRIDNNHNYYASKQFVYWVAGILFGLFSIMLKFVGN